jgi:competence protein ComEC
MADPELIFFLAVGLLAGMFAAGAEFTFFQILFLMTALLGALSLRSERLRRPSVWSGVALAVLIGSFYFHLRMVVLTAAERLPEGHSVFQGVVLDVRPYGKAQALTARLLPPFEGEVRIITSPDVDARYGDLREFQGTLTPSSGASDLPTSFRTTSRLVLRDQGSPMKQGLLRFRERVLAGFASLPAEEAGLLGGLTLGARASFPESLRQDFAKSGTTHLVALSGYNIGVLILLLYGGLGALLPRRITFACTIICIILFVLMTGAEASIVRAALMGSLILVAQEAGRIYSVRHAIVYAALLMALAEPRILVADLGFQLSFASFLGIAYLAPALRAAFRDGADEGAFGWRENLFTTIGAQAAVLPLVLGRFGSFPLASLPANLLLLPLVPFTMALGCLMAVAGFVSGYLATLVGWMVHIFLAAELAVVHFAAASPVSLDIELNNPILLAGYYALLAAFSLSMKPVRS